MTKENRYKNCWRIQKNNKDYLIIPKEIQIFNSLWKIKILKQVTSKGKKVNGKCNYSTKTISLTMQPQIKRTFFHEISHSKNHEMGWTNTESTAFMSSLLMESIFDQISPAGQFETQDQGLKNLIFYPEIEETNQMIKNIDKRMKKLNKKIGGKK